MFAGCFSFSSPVSLDASPLATFSQLLPRDLASHTYELSTHFQIAFFSVGSTYPYTVQIAQSKTHTVLLLGWCASVNGDPYDANHLLQSWESDPGSLLDQLDGEFLLFVEDRKNEQFQIIRDPLGTIPCAYCIQEHTIYFAADHLRLLRQLFPKPTISDEYLIASYFTYASNYTITPDMRIVKLLPAHQLIFPNKHREKQSRYWTPRSHRPASRIDLETALQQTHAILERQIRLRTNNETAIGTHVSGGIDSSLLTALIHEQVGKEHPLTAYSWSPDPNSYNDETQPDERQKIKQFAEKLRISLVFHAFDKSDFDQYMHEVCAPSEYFYELATLKHASNSDLRVIVSGWGGDEFLGLPNIPLYRSSLRAGHLADFIGMRKEKTGNTLFNHVRHALLQPRRQRPFYRLKTARNIGLMLRNFTNEQVKNRAPFRSKNDYYTEMLNYLHLPERMDHWYIQASMRGLRYTYPFLGRALVDWLYTLPDHLFYGPTFADRYFLKHLARTYLPNDIYDQPKTADYQRESLFQHFQDTWLWDHRFNILHYCQKHLSHLIDTKALEQRLQACQNVADIQPLRGILFFSAKNDFLTTWLEKN